MFTSLIPRKLKNGRGETITAYQCQELYCISRYNSKDNKLTYSKFFDEINEYAKKGNFDKLDLDDLPTRSTMNDWPAKYGWKENYEIYENYMNGTAQIDLQKLYLKNMRQTGMSLIEIKSNLILAIKKISEFPLDLLMNKTYILAKMTETLTMLNNLIQQDIEFGNDESDSEEMNYIEPVDLESDEFIDSELEYLEKLIERT